MELGDEFYMNFIQGDVLNIFAEETYQEKPIKVGEKNHEHQEHQSAGNFRQICSTSQEN